MVLNPIETSLRTVRRRWRDKQMPTVVLCILISFQTSLQDKLATMFQPTEQIVHVGVSITVYGANLATSDKLLLTKRGPLLEHSAVCGSHQDPPISVLGTSDMHLQHLASDGSHGVVTMTPTEMAECWLCVNLFPSTAWIKVGSSNFNVTAPMMSVVLSGSIFALISDNPSSVRLKGVGVVPGIDRLAFKLFTASCDSAGGLQSEDTGLSWANSASSEGLLTLVLRVTSSDISNLVLCFSSNGQPYFPVRTDIRGQARSVTDFTPKTALQPGIATTITFSGVRLISGAATNLEIMAGTRCSGHSGTSDVFGGDSRPAVVLSQSQAAVKFQLGPALSSVTSISIDVQGTGYLNGVLKANGGGGSGFVGSFTSGLDGVIDSAYINSPGVGFASDPTIEMVFPPGTRCGPESESDHCKMAGAVTRVIASTGQTKGCFAGVNITAVGDGVGFRAVVADTDVFGQIGTIEIVNFGRDYTTPPQLITQDTRCQCGTVFVEGQPLTSSYLVTTIAGNMDPCFTTVVASGAELSAGGGWQDRSVVLCSRFGTGAWQQIGPTALPLPAPSASPSTPAVVNSGQPFTVTVTGTGFAAGPMASRIKLSPDCAVSAASDRLGAVQGGEGRRCDSVRLVDGNQQCETTFRVFSTLPLLPLNVCRRFGGADYASVPGTDLSVAGIQAKGVNPTRAASAEPFVVTVMGANFDSRARSTLRVKVCASFVCSGGGEEANAGEACQGHNDSRTCLSGATCTASTACSFQNQSDSAGVVFGGDGAFAASIAGCSGGDFNCSRMVFNFTLLAMVTVPADLWITSVDGIYSSIPNSSVSVAGSELTALTAVPASANSAESFTFTVTGRNLAQNGAGAVKLKFANSTCDAGGTRSDESWSILGGSGRKISGLMGSSGSSVTRTGSVTFTLMTSRASSASSLCWRIGELQYRAVQVVDASSNIIVNGWTTTLTQSAVEMFTPSDYDTSLGDRALPSFMSREVVSVTVIGTNFGADGASPIRVRPVAMPFALDDTAKQCVFANTIVGGQDETCKEFRSLSGAEDGDVSAYCSTGSSLDSVRLQDFAPDTVGDWSGGRQFAVFSLQTTVLMENVRMLLCWRMSDDDDALFPWQVVGHVETRSESQGAIGMVFWNVFITHTYALSGAFVTTISHGNIVANVPFVLTVEGVGFGCSEEDPEVLLKVAVANTIQAMVGSDIGGGCPLGSESDTVGAVEGGAAVMPRCVSAAGEMATVVEIHMTVGVEFVTPLELCWSSTSGTKAFQNVFYSGWSSLVTFSAAPPRVDRVLVNNLPIGAASLMVHVQFSVSLSGEGLVKDGLVTTQLMVAEDCTDASTVVLGGEQRDVDCSFGTNNVTVEFNLRHRSDAAKLCIRRAKQTELWVPYLESTRFQCSPSYCGAPSCQQDTNYLFDGFSCDTECCLDKCQTDPNCRYWQYFEVVGRVFRKCQTSAHCFDVTVPSDSITTPFITQKTDGLVHEWQQLGSDLVIQPPRIEATTAQQEPALAPHVPFTVVLEGVAFADVGERIHVKLVDASVFTGGCNNETLFSEALQAWQDVVDERLAVEDLVVSLVNFSYNGTCAAGARNCFGGPAPPMTVCTEDSDCVPALGGVCQDANTGYTCLVNEDCTNGGFCNNSLYNLSITPTPVPPPLRIPFVNLAESGVIAGGDGRFLQVQSSSLGYVTFTAEVTAEAVICIAIRDPDAATLQLSDGFIVDRRYILEMASYAPYGVAAVRPPVITEVFPDHIFVHVPTEIMLGGSGLSTQVRFKLAYATHGCELREGDSDALGAVPGGEGRPLEWVNALGTNASVQVTITEAASAGEDVPSYHVCVQYSRTVPYRRAGHVELRQRPPIVIGFTPQVMYHNDPTEFRLFGSGLGGGQKIKLVQPDAGCRGSDLLAALRDDWGLAGGSQAAMVTQVEGSLWAELSADAFANETRYSRVSATLAVRSEHANIATGSVVDLCFKYSDAARDHASAGYHLVGQVSVRAPHVDRVVTNRLYAGRTQELVLEGSGIRSDDKLQIRILEAYCTCETLAWSDACVTAGGSGVRVLPGGITATQVRAEVSIPHMTTTTGRVCSKMLDNAWASVGIVQIDVIRIQSVAIRNRAGQEVHSVVSGEPILAQIAADTILSGREMVKLIPSDDACSGTDPRAGAFKGGDGRIVNGTGFVLFGMGVQAIPGLDSVDVRACVVTGSGTSYHSPNMSVTWPLQKPSVASLHPTSLRSRAGTVVQVLGRGLATQAVAAWLVITNGTACTDPSATWQLQSQDSGIGQAAQTRVHLAVPGPYLVCLRLSSEAEMTKVGELTVESVAKILSVSPTIWLVGNATAMLLTGSGLSEGTRVKWVFADSACSADEYPGGSVRGLASCNGGATEAISAAFTLEMAGSAKLCVADTAGAALEDSGVTVSVVTWQAPLLLSPPIGRRGDTQRVEAAMSDALPVCSANWPSDWMLTGPGDYISRDTPAIVHWQDAFKCWAANEAVPASYPQGVGYRAPGVDWRLITAIRGVPLRVVITGGVGLGDTVFVSRSGCGNDLTQPSLTPAADAVPGGEGVVITDSMIIDVTSEMCGGSRSVSAAVTGAGRRVVGVEVNLTMTEVSKPGQFHRICTVPSGFAQSIDVVGVDLKVGPPVLTAVEPAVTFAGLRVRFTLAGFGLEPGDEIKVMDAERYRACLEADTTLTLPGGQSVPLGSEETSSFASAVELQLTSPSTHARICYKYRGSDRWEEMTSRTQLRTSGYLYGYEGNMHFFFGELPTPQGADNRVGGDNQTISVLAPRALALMERETVAREPLTMTVVGHGLSEDGRYVVVPERVQCGGTAASRANLVQDGTGSVATELEAVEGGHARAPTTVENDAADNAMMLRRCTGSDLRGGCTFSAETTNTIDVPAGFGVSAIGVARVCYRYHRAAEYAQVALISILPPVISSASPSDGILLNKPSVLSLRGRSMASTDLITVVQGSTCNTSVSSRPYLLQLNVTDPPTNSRAEVLLTLTGPGHGSPGTRTLCYSYDGGASFVATGLTLRVVSPTVRSIFPTVLSLSAERRIHLYGDAISQGDRVKVIAASRQCHGTDDKQDAVYGGAGRALDVAVPLPANPALQQWPRSVATSGSAVFLLPRTDAAVVCYLHRDASSWQAVLGPDGAPLLLRVVSTRDQALGLDNASGPSRRGGAGRALQLWCFGFVLALGRSVWRLRP